MAIKDEFSGYIYVEFISNKSQASTIRVLDNFLKTMRIRVPQYRTEASELTTVQNSTIKYGMSI